MKASRIWGGGVFQDGLDSISVGSPAIKRAGVGVRGSAQVSPLGMGVTEHK